MITVRLLAGCAEPGTNSGTVRVLPIATVPWAVLNSAKSSLAQSAFTPVARSHQHERPRFGSYQVPDQQLQVGTTSM
jgi:hypothetical protein